MPSSSLLSCKKVLSPPLSSIGSGENLFEYQSTAPCWSVSFSCDGRLLAASFGAPDCCVRVWRLDTYELVSTLKDLHRRTVRCCSFAPVSTNYILATASFDGTIGVWEDARRDNSEGWDCIAQLEGHESECKWVTWNPTATLMATCGRDKTVWLWECSLPGNIGGGDDGDFECLAVLNGHDGDVKCSVFAPSHGQYDGDEILISASYDDTIRVWAEDAGDWFCVQILTEGNTVWSLALAPGGARFISGSADGSIGIYKFYTARERKEREGASSESPSEEGQWKCVGRLPGAHRSEVLGVSYAPAKAGHGRFASCGDALQIYKEAIESTSDHPLFSLEISSERLRVNSTQWHPRDGSILATAGDDGCVRVWTYGKAII